MSNCTIALSQGRYTWRHDNVLSVLAPDLYTLLNSVNKSNVTTYHTPSTMSCIRSESSSRPKSTKPTSLLTKYKASYWRINIYFDSSRTIPVECGVDTLLRPDLVIYSTLKRVIIWGELTVPLERNFVGAYLRNEARYVALKTYLRLKKMDSH